MIVAALPIDPPDGHKWWAFYVVNDTGPTMEAVVVEQVGYEWGDTGNTEDVGATFGPIAPGAYIEVYRETNTEVRTALWLLIRDANGIRRVIAEVGRLYLPRSSSLESIPIIGRAGKLATVEPVVERPAEPAAHTAGTIEYDDVGVRRHLTDGKVESARWSELSEIWIVTTADGPFADDMFWVLRERSGGGCVVPSQATGAKAIVDRLEKLPGFDFEQMILAMASTGDAKFVVWRAPSSAS
jgi:hypothetical protein